MIRRLLALVGAGILIGLCAPAHADPGDAAAPDESGFLAALRDADIGYGSPGQAVGSAQAVCACLDNGETGFELVHDLKKRNPGFTMDAAAEFAVISAKYYCPHQLAKS